MRNKLEQSQVEFLNARFAAWVSIQPDARDLQEKLLNIAGLAVVAPPNNFESDMQALLQSGRKVNGKVIVKAMPDNRCHQNVVELWRESGKTTFGIGTGFGLNDGLWRQHTWAMDDDVIVETTQRREVYFGVVLFGVHAGLFCQAVES